MRRAGLGLDGFPQPEVRRRVEARVLPREHVAGQLRPVTKPRGKQDWHEKPHSIWYPRTTGIWQTV